MVLEGPALLCFKVGGPDCLGDVMRLLLSIRMKKYIQERDRLRWGIEPLQAASIVTAVQAGQASVHRLCRTALSFRSITTSPFT